MVEIHIARDFTSTPGARYKKDGEFSGEEFREKFLEKHFENKSSTEIIKINFDGAAGYATSFLEETFGGLARKYGIEICLERLEFVSTEDPYVKTEVAEYIKNCRNNEK
jgi:hypothetical protein